MILFLRLLEIAAGCGMVYLGIRICKGSLKHKKTTQNNSKTAKQYVLVGIGIIALGLYFIIKTIYIILMG